ncbi:hypothetical protein O181_070270 [Austropuccinia psidii MF-1]|uniref:Uncharacterized protein n=1 Tax=Austropuccinia psidii MF-1 TaxID=1389203 RepID=A0A9Q3F4H0_9BASI|nr:hypothetical protein [Austropuccinia psidii MF-1]
MVSSSSKFDLEDLKSALANVDQTDTRVCKCLETERLGQSIAPHLTKDGMNFRHWSRSLYDSLLSYVEDVTSARKIYRLLESRFTHTSWPHIMNLFTTIINSTDDLETPDNGYAKIQANLKKLKTAFGGQWSNDSLMAMFFHHYNKKYFHQIANAVDARISIDPNFKANIQHSFRKLVFVPPAGDGKFKWYPHPSTCSEAWARQWLSPEHPCVHWAQDCPRKRVGKPAAEDPRIKQPDFRLRKLQHVSHQVLAGMEMNNQCGGNVEAIAKSPANEELVLLDSGERHHVTRKSIHFSYLSTSEFFPIG